jgi:hypothetical protein
LFYSWKKLKSGHFGSGVKIMQEIISRLSRGLSVTSLAVFGLGVIGFVAGAKAVIILPGQALPTTGVTSFAGPKVADSGLVPFTGTDIASNIVFTGLLDTQVYADAGGLDFVYQISNNANSADSILRLTASGLTGYSTDGDYIAGTGAAAPFLVNRSSDTDTVGFSFLAAAGVQPGQTSDIMVIKTDATAFMPSTVSIQDGGNANVDSFAPVAVPEPVSAAIVAFGFSALALRRHKNKA